MNKKGFTLIEFIVVLAIVAIFAAIFIPLIINYLRDDINDEQFQQNTDIAYISREGSTDFYEFYVFTLEYSNDAQIVADLQGELNRLGEYGWMLASQSIASGHTSEKSHIIVMQRLIQ
jgi:prepilin-type N-terminal cleavage/methylation domain-containing protein